MAELPFTTPVRDALAMASANARTRGSEVTDVDIALAVLGCGSCVAITLLRDVGVDLGTSRVALESSQRMAEAPAADDAYFSRRAKVGLGLAAEEARVLGQSYVGTAHLLVGLAAIPDGAVGAVFAGSGITMPEVRRALRQLLATEPEE